MKNVRVLLIHFLFKCIINNHLNLCTILYEITFYFKNFVLFLCYYISLQLYVYVTNTIFEHICIRLNNKHIYVDFDNAIKVAI